MTSAVTDTDAPPARGGHTGVLAELEVTLRALSAVSADDAAFVAGQALDLATTLLDQRRRHATG